jgi:cytochrome c oxidase assembly factor CtaG
MPDDAYIHALGVGGGMEFIKSVAGSGWIDSVDCSTPEMAAMFGRVMDAQLRQKPVRIASGEGVAKRNTALADFNSWQIHDAWEREETQAESRNTLEAYR